MTNREKAIKGLECCLANRHNNYPYKSTDEGIDKVTPCTTYLMQDALDLLEARAPTLTGGRVPGQGLQGSDHTRPDGLGAVPDVAGL